jgi:hypothetical protein
MLFQTLDDKNTCVGVYANNNLQFKNIPDDLTKTWSYSAFLKGKDIEYAQLYCSGQTLEQACPEHLKSDLEVVNKKLKAITKSIKTSKVSLRENCFYDLVPKNFLIELCEVKNLITEYILQNVEKPKEYNFIREFTEFITDIRYRNLNVDLSSFADNRELISKIGNKNYIKYNMHSSVTGRLTVSDTSFPILNLAKEYRSIIKPVNDWFVEFDFNAAELRTAMALLNKDQVEGDLHEWSETHVFGNKLNRSEAKRTATSWLYNSTAKLAVEYDSELSKLYNKKALVGMYWDGEYVTTPFSRKIKCDEYHAVSYLNQSTFIDLFHRQVLKANKILDGKRSFIPFLIHDSLALDLKDDEKWIIPEIAKALSDTKYGNFPVNVKIGRDYGNMKKIKLKAG